MSHYLDFAATSAIRPPTVGESMARYLTDCGATPGRGGHARALEAGRLAFRARRAVQRLLGLPGDPGRVTFCANATVALNTALWGTLDRGDILVVTAFDHNAVLRPAAYLAESRGVDVRMIPGTPEGDIDFQEAERLLRGARMLSVNAASNVLGHRLPVSELAARAHGHGALVLLDAAQSAGHFPMRCADEGADLVAFTGHKGMLGPQGTGGLWVRDGVDVRPLTQGGTGGDSRPREMPVRMPDGLEAGSLNAPGLAGLEAGIDFVLERGVESICRHEGRLKKRLRSGLESIPGIEVLSPSAPDGVGIVTLVVPGVDCGVLASRLEQDWGVQGRAGLHCAPESHRVLGSLATGAFRLSVGWATTDEDVDRALEGLEAVATSRRDPR